MNPIALLLQQTDSKVVMWGLKGKLTHGLTLPQQTGYEPMSLRTHCERKQSSNNISHPPFSLRSVRSGVVLWKWAKLLHKKLDSLFWTKQRHSILLGREKKIALWYICTATVGGRYPVQGCRWQGGTKQPLIGGKMAQSEACPSVQPSCVGVKNWNPPSKLLNHFLCAAMDTASYHKTN